MTSMTSIKIHVPFDLNFHLSLAEGHCFSVLLKVVRKL